MVQARIRAGLVCLALVLGASAAYAQAPTLTGSANGLALTLNWTAVPGAIGYELVVQGLGAVPIGNTVSLSGTVPAGTYVLAVRAVGGATSNSVTLVAALVPPAAPTDLSAAVGGNNLLLTWNVETAGLTGMALQVTGIGTLPIPVGKSLSLTGVPNGNYSMSVLAAGSGGISAASNPVEVAIPSCVPPTTLPFTVTSNGTYVQASWPAVPGATGYRLDASNAPGGGANLASVQLGPGTTNFAVLAPLGTYYLTLHATMSCGPTISSAEVFLDVVPPVRPPAKSEAGARAMVLEATNAAAGLYPGDLRNSCGNNTWMFRVLQRLRQQDNRFGLNWKRGNIGDLSQDVITYIFDDIPDELADQHHIYMWDIIGGHCGGNPTPNAGPNWSFSVPERWTITPYLSRGFAP